MKKKEMRTFFTPKLNRKKRFLREEFDIEELKAILDSATLSDSEHGKLTAALETLLFITQELEKKRVSLNRLKKMLFGDTSETTRNVIKKVLRTVERAQKDDGSSAVQDAKEKLKPKGHGRNGSDVYTGADKVHVPHESLSPKAACPKCEKGKVYTYPSQSIIRLTGGTPVAGKVYQLDRLRCNLCGEIFTAETPECVGNGKYDASSGSMIAILKYGTGMPFNRLEQLQGNLGIPLPSSTQWDILEDVARKAAPAFKELAIQAARGDVLHNDDTGMKILDHAGVGGPTRQGQKQERTGVFTSGIVSLVEGHKIALFYTGRNHAGENIAEVLQKRPGGLSPPIQMCDALSRNVPKDMKTVLANCLSHGRRQFVDVAGSFPDEVIHVLKLLKEVYINDNAARKREMLPQERLRFHQEHSKPYMDELKQWCEDQFESRKTEPNSSLGAAIKYMLKHWDKLTLFLHKPGAPLDNNICERALKKAIINRKNAYFYKTSKGAEVGDLFLSLIHTCELCQANPFEYLVGLQEYTQELDDEPQRWMPWNYKETITEIQAARTES